MAKMKKPKAPKGCTIESGHSKKSLADKKAKKLREDGYKARVIERKPNGKTKYFVTNCGKRKK